MVSHSVIVAASSPVMAPSPAPTIVSNLPPLMTTITKRSVLEANTMTKNNISISKGNNNGKGNGNKDLEKLFNIGAKRFDLKDADRDEFSDIYVRALQAALLGAAKRNRATLCKLESLRSKNAKLRAVKVEERVAATRAAEQQQQA